MLLRSVLLCAMILLGFLSSQTDSRRVCKDHSRHCRQLGTKRPLFRCYRKGTRQQCCATCREKEDPDNPDCAYGDKLAWCSSIGNRYSVVSCYTHEVECCGTCARLAKREIPDCPYGDREIWCPYFTREKCLEGESSACCETCYNLLQRDGRGTHQAGTEMNSEAKAVTEGTNNLTSIIPTTSTTTTTSPTTTTPSVAGGKQTTENQTVTTKPPIPESKSKNSSTVAPTQNTKPQKVSSNNKTGSLTSPVVSESYQTVTTTVLTPAIASGQNVTSSVTWTDKAAGSSSAHVRNMSSSSATVTYNTRTSQKSVSPPSTLSTLPATEIHIRLHQTSRPPSSNVTKVRDHLYHSSLTDDEDYAPASGDGDDDITIDDVTDERGHGGHHRDKDRHRDGNGGHHGGHHHKKGHHHGNGVTQEDYIFDDLRSSGVPLAPGVLGCLYGLSILTIANQGTDRWIT